MADLRQVDAHRLLEEGGQGDVEGVVEPAVAEERRHQDQHLAVCDDRQYRGWLSLRLQKYVSVFVTTDLISRAKDI